MVSIALNLNCPTELQRGVVLVDDFDTRMNLVYNPSCSSDVLVGGFVQRYIDNVGIEYAIYNANCSTEFLEKN